MAKKITPNDLFSEQDIFKGIRKSAEQTIKIMEKLQGELKQTAEGLKKSIGGAKFDSGKAIKNFTKETKEALKVQKEYAQTQKVVAQAEQQRQKAIQQAEITEQKRNQTKKTELDLARKQQLATERENKARERKKKLLKDEASAYKKLVKATRDLKNQSKDLGAQLLQMEQAGKKNTAEYRKLSREYDRVTRSAKKGDAQLKKLDKTVGDNFRNVGNYKGAISKLTGVLSQLGIAFGISTVVRGAFNSITSFEDANAKLSAVLGTTTDKTKDLQDVQRELGRSTSFTAGEVAELQVELAKLGFSQDDIKNSTEGILMLAKASGTDLANASEIAGSTLRAFGLDVSQTGHLADVMAKSFSSSALDITLFKESMKFVAPVSKSANVSLEETTALLSILANNGIKGSQAGTSLKRIMSEMAKTGKPLKEALQDVAEAGIDLTSAQDEVGRSAQTSLLILADNVDKIDGFTELYNKADGSAQKMASTMDDTLSGSIKRLGSAWEGFLLDMNEGTGASNSLREAIDFLSENLTQIMNVVVTALEIWVKYQFVIKASALSTKLMNAQFIQMGRNIGGLKGLVAGIRGAFQKLGQAIQTNIVGLTALVGFNMINQFKRINDITASYGKTLDQVTQEQKKLTDATEKQKKEAGILFNELRNGNLTYEQRQNVIDKINKQYGTTLKNMEDEVEFIKQIDDAQQDLIKTLDTKLAFTKAEARLRVLSQRKEEVSAEMASIQATISSMSTMDYVVGNLFRFFGATSSVDLQNQYNANYQVFKKIKAEVEDAEKEYDKLFKQMAISGTTGITGPATPTPSPTGATKKDYDKSIKDFNKFYDEYNEVQKRLNALKEEARRLNAMETIEGDITNAVKRARETGEAQTEIIEKQIEDEFNIRIANAEKIAKAEKSARISDAIQRSLERRAEIKAEYKEKLKAIPVSEQGQRNELTKEYGKRLRQLKAQEKDEQDVIVLLNKETNEKLKAQKEKLNDEMLDLQNDFNDQINEGLEEYAENVNEQNQKEIEDTQAKNQAIIDAEAEKWNTLNTFVQNSADFFIEQSNRKIEQIDREINKAKEQYDFFKQLAVQGNIDAQQSLAEQQRIIDEAEAKKLKQQRIQQAIELTSSALSTYNNYVSQGKDDALAKTISDIGLLQAFINSLPAFYDGTEDTGKNGRGLDGKGGFNAILHPNERVIPKHLNDRLGGISNEELTDIAQRYKLNGLKADSQVMSALDLSLLGTKIDNLTAVVKDKPETNIELGSITQSLVEIVHKTKKGNTTTYNRFKVKK